MILNENEKAIPIADYPNYYITNQGRVWSEKNQIWLKQNLRGDINKNSLYLCVSLSKDGQAKSFPIHRLVAKAFLPNPNNLPFVNHKDENKTNNDVNNLEWCTEKYNRNYGECSLKMVETKKQKGIIKNVIMCDKITGEELKFFSSCAEAAEEITKNRKNGSRIGEVCRGIRKNAFGYSWKYAD